jgi:hypothetical protein
MCDSALFPGAAAYRTEYVTDNHAYTQYQTAYIQAMRIICKHTYAHTNTHPHKTTHRIEPSAAIRGQPQDCGGSRANVLVGAYIPCFCIPPGYSPGKRMHTCVCIY